MPAPAPQASASPAYRCASPAQPPSPLTARSATPATARAAPPTGRPPCRSHDVHYSVAPYSHGRYAAAVLRPCVSEELCWIVSHHPLFQMHYYGAQTGDDVNAREAYRTHPWFDATVEFC